LIASMSIFCSSFGSKEYIFSLPWNEQN